MRCALALYCGDCSIDFGRLLVPQPSRRSSIARPGRAGSAARKGRGPGRADGLDVWQVEETYTNQEAGSVGRPGDTGSGRRSSNLFVRDKRATLTAAGVCVYVARVQRLPGTTQRVRRTYSDTNTHKERYGRRRGETAAICIERMSARHSVNVETHAFTKDVSSGALLTRFCFTTQFHRDSFPSV